MTHTPKIEFGGHAISIGFAPNNVTLTWRGWPADGGLVRQRFVQGSMTLDEVYLRAAKNFKNWMDAGPKRPAFWTPKPREIERIIVGDLGPDQDVIIVKFGKETDQ